jgi:hypothetical protein
MPEELFEVSRGVIEGALVGGSSEELYNEDMYADTETGIRVGWGGVWQVEGM